jgi:hypothetical protein
VKHALVFVSIAVGGGLAALLALRPFAPAVGPVIGVAVIAVALLSRSFVGRGGGEGEEASSQRSSAPA